MRSQLLSAVLASSVWLSASAQSINGTFVTGLYAKLTSLGLNQVAAGFQFAANTPVGQTVLENISGPSKTLVAPVDAAVNQLPPSIINNATLVGEVLSYHLLSGTFDPSSFAASPAHTIARTFLNDPEFVELEGGKSQVAVLSNVNGKPQVVNQAPYPNVNITSTAQYEDLLILIVDQVILPGGSVDDEIANYDGVEINNFLSSTTVSFYITPGQTIFLPSDAAFVKAEAQLQALDPASLQNVIDNHVINGTTVYSTELASGSFVSAGGQPYTFEGNSIVIGSVTAKIIISDVTTSTGVIHVIDTVLLDTQLNAAAASAAQASYSSIATAEGPARETGPVGVVKTAAAATPSPRGKRFRY